MGYKTILLGLSLGDPHLPTGRATLPTYNPASLLRYLETFYGLGAPAVNRNALRIEQYRQLLTLHLEGSRKKPFYAATFAADPSATAEELLSRRDELLDGAWRLTTEATDAVPARLRVTLEVERLLLDEATGIDLLPGPADRLRSLMATLPEDRHPRLHILLNEPRDLLDPGTRRLLIALERRGDRVAPLPEPSVSAPTSDLCRWQRALCGGHNDKPTLSGDGSLILVRAQRETHIAAYLARALRRNPAWKPSALLTVRNQTLDNALVTEGLPSMGIPSDSLARPSLQVLKLVTAFLWEPIEVERIMEFVSLVSKPLHPRLAGRIAKFLSDTPGLFGPRWRGMIERFFREMKEYRAWNKEKLSRVRGEYEQWFERRRFDRSQAVPRTQLRMLFLRLREWALEERGNLRKADLHAERRPGEYSGLLVLYSQAQRAVELLDAQPEDALNYLAVERLVRTVYEPAPAQFSLEEKGALSPFFAPASAIRLPDGPAPDRILWWDFIENEPDYFFSRYNQEELRYLSERGVSISGPAERNALAIWQQRRPVLHASRQLILCLPERVDGAEVEPHPMLGDLEAAFAAGSLERITVRIDRAGEATGIPQLISPEFAEVPLLPLDPPVPHLAIDRLRAMGERAAESPTSMEALLFYPHKYVFRHALQLRGMPILSIASEARLRGNLAHRLIEQLLTDVDGDVERMTKDAVEDWIDTHSDRLFKNQGAVLLQYGQEPERIQFVRTMKKAAWALVYAIKENGWCVRGCEQAVYGDLETMGQGIRGRADLVLTRRKDGLNEVAIVDLKWQGKTAFENLLKNNRDVQLALYGDLAKKNQMRDEDDEPLYPQPDRIHAAYFLIRFGKLLSRNQLAFRQAVTVGDEQAASVYDDMLHRIRNTYGWRWGQFREGRLEVRCEATSGALDDAYVGTNWDELFEMETTDPPFDDYRSLIGLVR